MKSIKQYKKLAKNLYDNNRKTSIAIAAICIYSIIFIGFSTDNLMFLFKRQHDLITSLSSILIFFLSTVFSFGIATYTLETVRKGNGSLNTFLSAFDNLANVLLLGLLKGLFVFLWSLLFVIPGIIALYRYRMAEYIMADNPEISPLNAIRLSKKMMQGKKMKAFDLDFSFIGWFLLSVVTCGIVGLYAIPYANLTVAQFYTDVNREYIEEQSFRAEWEARKAAENNTSTNNGTSYENSEKKT